MSCFSTSDIGGCGSPGGGTCLQAFRYFFAIGTQCCICSDSGHDVTVVFDAPVGGALYSSATWTLQYGISGTTYWYSPPITVATGTTWQFAFEPSVGGLMNLYLGVNLTPYGWGSAAPSWFLTNGYSALYCLGSPPNADYSILNNGNPLYVQGARTANVAWTQGDPLCCLWTTNFTGCNSLPVTNGTVTWWTDSSKATQVSTGSSGANSWIDLGLGPYGTTGTYYREVSSPRFALASGNKAISCGGSDTVALSPATGYHCVTWNSSACGLPVADTLHVTFVNAGARTFVYSGGNWVCAFTYGGNAYTLTLTPAGTITGDRGGFPFAVSITSGPTCPPAFAMSIHPSGIGAALGDGTITE